jgi:hypothetical protein
VKILRGILAITLIAMLLIGNLIESAAHAGTPDCVDAHCHEHAPSDVANASSHSHDSSEDDQVAHECCDQIFCQAVTLSDFPTLDHPIGLRSASWVQIGQFSAVNRPRTPERPPNS